MSRDWRPALLAWYRSRKRDLPWRKGISVYRTWVSEIMLQQTTVAAVVPYYARFLERFPTVTALAEAPESEVLRLWAGLGYYSRARNLHAAAKRVAAERGGRFPDTFEGVLDLPGVGRYTAGAVCSIALGLPTPVVDGNVARVFARLFLIDEDVKKPAALAKLWEKAESLLVEDAPGDWNQALMELGATVCVPEAPRCADCPVRASCAAFAACRQEELPRTVARREPVDLSWTCLWLEQGGKVLLWRRAEDERFLPGHWGLPERRHLKLRPGAKLGTARHTITFHRIKVSVHAGQAPSKVPAEAEWVPREKLHERLVSSLWSKCARAAARQPPHELADAKRQRAAAGRRR